AELLGQLDGQGGDDFLPVVGTLFLEDVRADAAADLPVEQDQGGIDGLGDAFAGLPDQVAQVVEELGRGGGSGPALGCRRELLAWFLAFGHGRRPAWVTFHPLCRPAVVLASGTRL